MKRMIALIILAVVAVTTIGYTQDTIPRPTVYIQDTIPKPVVYVTEAEPVYVVPVAVRDWNTRVFVGLKGGLNYSNVYDSHGEDFEADSKFGFAVGAFLAIPLGRHLGLQPEVLFSQRGFHGRGTLLDNSYKLTRTSNYIDVPLLLAIKAGRGLTILAGPQFSYLLKQKDEFNNSTQDVSLDDEFDAENIRKNTLCFTGGLDFNIDHFVIGTRVGWDIRDNKGDGSSSTPRYKNAWLQATVGLRF